MKTNSTKISTAEKTCRAAEHEEVMATIQNHHRDSGYRCLVAHLDAEGHLLPPCRKCIKCGKWLRPEDFDGECEVYE